jgi:rod shape-determining protein MreC
MDVLISRYRNLSVLLVVILAQLVLLAYQVKSNQDVRLIRVWAVTAVTPLAKVLEVVRANTIGVAENYFVLINVRNENKRLSDEVGRLKMENQFLRTELQTADRVQALRQFQARTPSRTLPARIIGTGTGANSRVVFVDQGSAAGVMRGMAVVTPDGIVGKVLASYPTASQVLLITDASFAAGVISDKNRVHGTLKGTGQNKCIVDYVQNEEKVEPGEMFYTSGDDRIFPKGMPAGKVNVVRNGKNFKEIFVVPNGFQAGLEEVLIVVEGIHQPIPEAKLPAASEIYVAPPAELPKPPAPMVPGAAPAAASGVPGAAAAPAQQTPASGLQTDADRLRDRYKRIGESQGHTFGEGLPGSKPPNFNVDPDAPKAAPAQPPAGTKPVAPGGVAQPGGTTSTPAPPAVEPVAPGGTAPGGTTAQPAPAKPAATVPGSPATAKPKPQPRPQKPATETAPPR